MSLTHRHTAGARRLLIFCLVFSLLCTLVLLTQMVSSSFGRHVFFSSRISIDRHSLVTYPSPDPNGLTESLWFESDGLASPPGFHGFLAAGPAMDENG
jgi:hypothetical protein